MKLTLTKERIYTGPMGPKRSAWFARLDGETVASAETKDEAESKAYQALYDAFTSTQRSSVVRVAKDRTIIVFRWIGSDAMMYEFIRDGKTGGSCMGRLTDGITTYRNLEQYADYVVSQYDGVCVAA